MKKQCSNLQPPEAMVIAATIIKFDKEASKISDLHSPRMRCQTMFLGSAQETEKELVFGPGGVHVLVFDPCGESVEENNTLLVKQFGTITAKAQSSKKKNNLYNDNSLKHSSMELRSIQLCYNTTLCKMLQLMK